jgi:hypothetical protein
MKKTQTNALLLNSCVLKRRMPYLLARATSCARPLALFVLVVFSSSTLAQETAQPALDSLIDGLHKDAHEGNFEPYFARYTSDAVFMGTDKTERWTIDEFKTYAAPAFEDGHGWTYRVVERNWEGGGDTRWFDEILFNEKLGHCRGTGVVEKVGSNWKIAHYSLTLLIPNDIAETVGNQSKRAD